MKTLKFNFLRVLMNLVLVAFFLPACSQTIRTGKTNPE